MVTFIQRRVHREMHRADSLIVNLLHSNAYLTIGHKSVMSKKVIWYFFVLRVYFHFELSLPQIA